MSKETKPLFDDKQRSNANQELVGRVLGKQAAQEMGELADDKSARADESGSNKLEMREDEKSAANEIEHTVKPEVRRRQLVEWVESYISSDAALNAEYTAEDWVDTIFTINSDGAVDAPGTINLSFNDITYLPEGLNEINGDFLLSSTPLKSLENLPKKINGNLDITHLRFCKSIPSGIIVTGKVEIQKKQTELLADAKEKGYDVEVVK